ncbi:MAG: LptE family protein [Thermoguttaceae bacterium]
MFRFLTLYCLLATILLLGGCAGYRVGAMTLYNDNIRTVYVPMFESDSFRRNLSERVTEAVCKKIEARTPYKVIGRPTADSILSGRIISDTQSVMVVNEYDDVRQKKVTLTVEVVWTDRRGRELRRMEPVPWDVGSETIASSWDMVAEMGDSTIMAQQRAIDKLADQIVYLMEAPW